ncbi:hypothetical protein C9374_002959 [Naegleria lovaniensis]|uniref:Inner centromere protein ARK-binding domain-containing protein n=1 Tax=Naegleria lovaniensis TaxID=51637 RepID=A0AA88KJM9_NAELO|nr:uncharacterized protein C9374_002959 [Naegleria lovaniensis]KAG2385810.1 hypothetical protein C9374_002959 [Naegleria lovaniensis]
MSNNTSFAAADSCQSTTLAPLSTFLSSSTSTTTNMDSTTRTRKLTQIILETENTFSKYANELQTRFDQYIIDLNSRADFIQDQILKSSSLYFATPSFKGLNDLASNSGKKPFHRNFNHSNSGKKKTPLRSPPIGVYQSHLPLHKSSPNMMIVPSPLMRKQITPLATRNLEQEQNIHNGSNSTQQFSLSPAFRSFQSPKSSMSSGRKKKFSNSSTHSNGARASINNKELVSPQQSPIPMIIDNTELERDLLSSLPTLDLEKDIENPIEPVLNQQTQHKHERISQQRAPSGLSDDLDMIHTVESLSTDSDNEKSEHLIIAGTSTSTSHKSLSTSQTSALLMESKKDVAMNDTESSAPQHNNNNLEMNVHKEEAISQPISQNLVQSLNNGPVESSSCTTSVPSLLNIQMKKEELSSEEEVVVVKKQKRQVRRKAKTPNHHQHSVPTTSASTIMVDLTTDSSGETNVTEQISHLSLFENRETLDKMVDAEIPTPVSADVLRPEIIFPTSNIAVKQEPISPVVSSQPPMVQTTEKSYNFSELDGHLTDDSVLCLSVPSDSEVSDLFEEENEKDVCVQIDFASPPPSKLNNNNDIQSKAVVISEIVPPALHPPKIPDTTEDLICDAQNLFSKFAFSSTTTSTDLLKSLQEKISSLKSIESPQSSYPTSLNEENELNKAVASEMPLTTFPGHPLCENAPTSTSGGVDENATLEPATPTAVVGAMEKLGQLSIHNKKVEQWYSSPEVQLSPPPFESMQRFVDTPVKEAKTRVFSPAASNQETNLNAAPNLVSELSSHQMEESTTPNNNERMMMMDSQNTTPPPSAFREPPTVSQHGKYKMLTPKVLDSPVPISTVANMEAANDDVHSSPNITATTLAEDPMEVFLSKKDSINIIDVDEHDEHDHKRKFQSKMSSDSNDMKRVKLSDGNRLSVASITSISSVSSTASSVSASSNHTGSFVSNIFTGVKSFVFKATQKKTSNNSSHASKKPNINSLKQAELAKKREEEKKALKKEKLEKQLAAQKKKKEQEDEQSKKQRPLSNKNMAGSLSGKTSHVEGTTLQQQQQQRPSNSSTSQVPLPQQQQAPQPPKRPVGLILKHTSQPLLQSSSNNKTKPNSVSTSSIPLLQQSQLEQQRYSSYALSDEYNSSEDEDEARKRRQSKKIPSWAQGDNLRRNLRRNLRVDPDKIFSVTKTCDLEEIFAGSTNEVLVTRFRQRTSSSNWTEDHFTIEEEQAYREEMGFDC